MAARCLLFAYGLLQPGHRPPRSASRWWKDRVRGVLYDLGPYPGAVRVGDPAESWIEGSVVEIETDELSVLDEFEDVESGEFRRLITTTEQGHLVWVYEYGRPIPGGLSPLVSWPAATIP